MYSLLISIAVLMNHELQFVEDFGLYWEEQGLPRMTGRILAWLLICDPPEQTMHDLTEALQASKSSISTGTRMLIQFGMVERVSLPGERRDYFRIEDGVWTRLLERKQQQLVDFRKLAERGLALLGKGDQARLREMRNLFAFMEQEYPLLLDHWHQQNGEDST